MTGIPGPTTDINGGPLDFGTSDGSKPHKGHCCRALTLKWPFLDLDASYRAAVAGKKTFTRQDGIEHEVIPDILTIGPMLRLVGVCNSNPLSGDLFPEQRKVWRCIHNREDFTCAIYDKRPNMCRVYPDNYEGLGCQYAYCESADCPGHRSNNIHPPGGYHAARIDERGHE